MKVGTNLNLSYAKTRQVGTSGDGFGDGNPGASIVRYALFRTPATPVYNDRGQFVDLPMADGKIAAAFFGDGIPQRMSRISRPASPFRTTGAA